MEELEEQIINQQAKISKKNKASKLKNSREFISNTNSPLIFDSLVPFHHRLKNNKVYNQFSQFFSIFKQLHINIPIIEAIEQMPKYAEFFKNILSK